MTLVHCEKGNANSKTVVHVRADHFFLAISGLQNKTKK